MVFSSLSPFPTMTPVCDMGKGEVVGVGGKFVFCLTILSLCAETLLCFVELMSLIVSTDRYLKQNWIYFSGSFYYISTTEKSWQDSRIDCWGRGADLIIIGSKEENFQKRVWIGLSDRQIEGRWIWLDGSALRKSFWYPGEPNNDGDREDCAEMKFFNKENSWNDAPCTNKYFWICEKKTGV
uniref:C-type lectin domain-containing protein n=1 Tax=Oryzias melastigma TaxID=30732 RepID=A0A3B3C0H6_ORYME